MKSQITEIFKSLLLAEEIDGKFLVGRIEGFLYPCHSQKSSSVEVQGPMVLIVFTPSLAGGRQGWCCGGGENEWQAGGART